MSRQRLSNSDLDLLLKIAAGTEMQRRIESKLKKTKKTLHEVDTTAAEEETRVTEQPSLAFRLPSPVTGARR